MNWRRRPLLLPFHSKTPPPSRREHFSSPPIPIPKRLSAVASLDPPSEMRAKQSRLLFHSAISSGTGGGRRRKEEKSIFALGMEGRSIIATVVVRGSSTQCIRIFRGFSFPPCVQLNYIFQRIFLLYNRNRLIRPCEEFGPPTLEGSASPPVPPP